MSSETKKRLLLSKWRTEQETSIEHDEKVTEKHWRIDDLETVLSDVKYWMHDALVLHLPMRDPRVILRKVEDVLG